MQILVYRSVAFIVNLLNKSQGEEVAQALLSIQNPNPRERKYAVLAKMRLKYGSAPLVFSPYDVDNRKEKKLAIGQEKILALGLQKTYQMLLKMDFLLELSPLNQIVWIAYCIKSQNNNHYTSLKQLWKMHHMMTS